MAQIIRSAALSPERRTLAGAPVARVVEGAASAPEATAATASAPVPDPAAERRAREHEEREARARQEREQRAREKARQEEQQREAEQLFAKAREEGYQAGYAAGEEAGHAALREAAAQLHTVAIELESRRAGVLAASEETVVAIAFEAICKVLGVAMASSEGVAAQVKQVLARVRSTERLVVRLHPVDLERLDAHQSDSALRSAQLEWRADAALAHGGCVVDTGGGSFEARLERQLEQVKEALRGARSAVQPDGRPS